MPSMTLTSIVFKKYYRTFEFCEFLLLTLLSYFFVSILIVFLDFFEFCKYLLNLLLFYRISSLMIGFIG